MRRIVRVFVVSAVIGVASFVAPAAAQVPPPPAEATPVLEVIAPTASPVCGNALLVVALAPGLVAGPTGGALPIETIAPAFGALFIVCGAVPAPPARLTCEADRNVNALANAIVAAIAGTPLPVGVDLVGAAVEQTIVLQDTVAPPSSVSGLLGRVVATLNCTAATSPVPPPEPRDEPAPADESYESVLSDELSLAPLLDTLTPYITRVAPAPRPGPLPVTPAVQVADGGFHYPIVFALPLVLMILGGYLGRALTQPVAPPHR